MKYDDEFDDWMIHGLCLFLFISEFPRLGRGLSYLTWSTGNLSMRQVPLRPGDGDHQTGIALGKANPTHPKRMKVFMCFVYNIKLAKICSHCGPPVPPRHPHRTPTTKCVTVQAGLASILVSPSS